MITSERKMKQKPFPTPLTPWDTFQNFPVVSISILLAPTHSILYLFISVLISTYESI